MSKNIFLNRSNRFKNLSSFDEDNTPPQQNGRNYRRQVNSNRSNSDTFRRNTNRQNPVIYNSAKDFPLSTDIDNDSSYIKTSKFKDVLMNVIKPVEPEKEVVLPGWVSIKIEKRKLVYNYGAKTQNMIIKEAQMEYEKTPNYIMDKAIQIMSHNWKRYEKEYDSLHGEGSYSERFRLPNVYDSDDDEDENLDTFDNSDFDE